MRNLKKILALVLALVMSLSLVTTAGAFSDDGDINASYDDAVKVLSELGVFQGYSDGSFQPKGSITRAEVAAIIYRIVTADVKDTQANIHSTWGEFTDVKDGAWYAGYVNYCANAKYIKGRGNGIFAPQDTVTGYEALAMILRAVGYDKNGEFTGSNWQVNTASIARERGVLKNVLEGQLGAAASRELVAEILFRSIIIPKVEFNTNTLSYKMKGDKETIGYESFKLEKITGIVTGNEFADLENSKTMNEGKTRMIVDGSKYIVDYSTGVDDLGEERSMYITNANTTSAKFLVLEDSDKNVTFETLDKKGIGSDSDFKKETGLQRGAETQQFLNFDEVQEWKSDWKVKYVLTSNEVFYDTADATAIQNAEAWVKRIKLTTNFTFDGTRGDNGAWYVTNVTVDGKAGVVAVYEKEFRIGDAITGIHRANIEEIFNVADKYNNGYVKGEVYVGTTSMKDISDELSLKQFVEQYINNTEGKISDNENGNWLKVIDNDNDGQADYVFKIVYTMAQVVRAKDGKYGLDTEDRTLCGGDAVNEITRDDAVSEDTLGLGDIVYYAFIDDVIRAYKAETASVKVDTVNRKDEKVTTTDGTEYSQSGVHGNHVLSKEYNCGVVYMNGSATYDIFLDRGGYLALFTDSNAGDFKLIVDGWYNSTKSGIEYAARVYNDETGRQDVVDITNNGSMFIDSVVWGANTVLNNDWGALKWLGGTHAYDANKNMLEALTNLPAANAGKLNGNGVNDNGDGNQVKTTVATLTGDGIIQPVDYVSNSNTGRTVRMLATEKNAIPTSAASYNATVYWTDYALTRTDTAYDTAGGTVEVRALSNTVYYFVYPRANAESGFAVERYVGYSNVPSVNSDYVEDVYAVATQQERVSTLGDKEYYTANVVVVELTRDYKGSAEEVFIYNMPMATSSVQIENVDLIHADGTKEEDVKIDFRASNIRDYRVALPANWENWMIPNWNPGLYYMYPTNAEGVYTVEKMSPAAIAELGYAVGWVGTSIGTLSSNYVSVVTFDNTDTANDNGIAYNMTEPANASNSNIYTLSYNNKGLADLGVYAGSEGWIQKYLGEKHSDEIMAADRYTGSFPYDHTPYQGHDSWWNQNRVLVHYAANGDIQYAISFANRDGDGVNAARDVWAACRPTDSAWSSSKTIDRATALKYADFMQRYGDIDARYNISNVFRARMAVTVYDLRKAVNDTDAMDAIEKLLNGHVDEAVVTKIGKDALLNVLTYANTTGSLDDEIAFVNGGAVTPEQVTVTFTGDNATVTLKDADEPTTEVTVDPDTDVVFTVEADEGYVIESVTVAGEPVDYDKDSGEYTVTADTSKTVEIKAVKDGEDPGDDNVVVTFSVTGGNAVVTLDDGNEVVDSVEVEEGSDVVFAVEAGEGYELETVAVDGEALDADKDGYYTVTADADVTVEITVKAVSGGTAGTVNIDFLCAFATGVTESVTKDSMSNVAYDENGTINFTNAQLKATGMTSAGNPDLLPVSGLSGEGVEGTATEDGWTITIPGLADGTVTSLTLTVKYGGSGGSSNPEDPDEKDPNGTIGGGEWLGSRARAGEDDPVGTARLSVYVKNGYGLVGTLYVQAPEGKVLNPKGPYLFKGESDKMGYSFWTVDVQMNKSLFDAAANNGNGGLSNDALIVFDIKAEKVEETDPLPIKVIYNDTDKVYEFYGYGDYENVYLTDVQVLEALAAELKVDKTMIQVDRTNGIATVNRNGSNIQKVFFKAVGDDSAAYTGELFKITNNGKILGYVPASGGKVAGVTPGVKYLIPVESDDVVSSVKAVTNGEITYTPSLDRDWDYVDALELKCDATSTEPVSPLAQAYYNLKVNGVWATTNTQITGNLYAKAGKTIQIVAGTVAAATQDSPKTGGLLVNGVEVEGVERQVLRSSTANLKFIYTLPAVGECEGNVVNIKIGDFTDATETYDVYVNGKSVGSITDDRAETGMTYFNIQTDLEPGTKVKAIKFDLSSDIVVTAENMNDAITVGLDKSIKLSGDLSTSVTQVGSKKEIRLYTYSKIQAATGLTYAPSTDDMAAKLDGIDVKAIDLSSAKYVADGTIISVKSPSGNERQAFIGLKEGTGDVVLKGTVADAKDKKASFEYTVNGKEATLSLEERVFNGIKLTLEGLTKDSNVASEVKLVETVATGASAILEQDTSKVKATIKVVDMNTLEEKTSLPAGKWQVTVSGLSLSGGEFAIGGFDGVTIVMKDGETGKIVGGSVKSTTYGKTSIDAITFVIEVAA